MSTGDRNDLKNILIYGTPKGTIEVKPHPEDVIEVDPSILIKMQAKLKGESFDDVYGQDERISSEFLIRKETEKLKRIFGNAESVSERFSSIKAINEIRKELEFEDVDRELLDKYSLKLSGGAFVDECDLYNALLSKSTPQDKQQRLKEAKKLILKNSDDELLGFFQSLEFGYIQANLEPLQVTKELADMFRITKRIIAEGNAVNLMNNILKSFYLSVRLSKC